MHRIPYLSCAGVLLVAVLTGCDVMGSSSNKGPAPKTLSHAAFVRKANRACAGAEQRTKKFKGSRNFAVVEGELRKVFIPAQEHMVVTLRALQPPASDAAGFQDWLTTFDQLDITIHEFLDAADARHIERVKALDRRLALLGRRFDRQAAKLGLSICAKD